LQAKRDEMKVDYFDRRAASRGEIKGYPLPAIAGLKSY
jgi:hypothetical protein